jgi:hypothetical protein
MGLKEMYESWNFRPVMEGDGNTPRNQAEGLVAVDFLPNTYQTEVRNRTPGNKTVTQATADDATNGTFNTTTGPNKLSAFAQYTRLFGNTTLTRYKSKIVHKYNAQGTTPNSKFITSDDWKNSEGVLYSTNS